MGEMVERVREAMRAAMWEHGIQFGKSEMTEFARAAIAAMREPTGEMIQAGNLDHPFHKGRWQTVIDAALNDENPAAPREKDSGQV